MNNCHVAIVSRVHNIYLLRKHCTLGSMQSVCRAYIINQVKEDDSKQLTKLKEMLLLLLFISVHQCSTTITCVTQSP